MENRTQIFNTAEAEFKKAKASEKSIENLTQLYWDDILISEKENGDCFEIIISDTVKHIVIANKNLENKELNVSIFVSNDLQKTIEADWVYKLIKQIEWLGNIKNKFIDFYNSYDFDNKLDKVGKVWFDGLEIMDLYIRIENDETIVTEITFSDYLRNDIGISFSFKDQIIEDVEYGC